jgi:hypothetical protein
MTSLVDLVRKQRTILESEAKAFSQLDSVKAKCDLGGTLAIKDDLFGCSGAVKKNGSESEARRSRGNAHFKANQLELALVCYTEAVLTAPAMSEVILFLIIKFY